MLRDHVAQIRVGYSQYVASGGDATRINHVPVPTPVATFLTGHYGSPPADIQHIKEIRKRSGISCCPMCGSMHAGTLDHVLPKANYPAFSIFGINLVPACKCNGLRGIALTGNNAGERVLHPYFDDILGERILSAQFEDLGRVPRVSLRLLISAEHPSYAGVCFHVKSVVEKTQIKDYLRRSWGILIKRPSHVAAGLRHNPLTQEDLANILSTELDRLDGFHESRNNWNSVFMAGLLDNHVLSWLFEKLSSADRPPDGALLP